MDRQIKGWIIWTETNFYSDFKNLWNTCRLLLLRHMSFLRVGGNVNWLQRGHDSEQLCTVERCVMVEVFYICIAQSPVSCKRLKWLIFTWEGLGMHHKVCAVSGKWVRFRRTRAFQVAKVIAQSRKIEDWLVLRHYVHEMQLESGSGLGIMRGLKFYIKESGPYLLVIRFVWKISRSKTVTKVE